MSDEKTKEAVVQVEGVSLTQAESMALRVAVSTFLIGLQDPEMRAGLGAIAAHYERHLQRIELLMLDRVWAPRECSK